MLRPIVILSALSALVSAQEKSTYDDHVLPIFEQACLNCHNPDKSKGGLDLSSFTATLKGGSGGKIVAPGDTASTLIAVVRQSAEPKMPPEGDKLSEAQIKTLSQWIQGGLRENKASSARKPSQAKFAISPVTDPAEKPEGPPPMPAHLLLEPAVITPVGSAIHAIACSPWAPLLAVTGQHQILLHHTQSLELLGILPFPEGDPISLAFTPDARYLIVGGGVPGKSGTTVTYDITTGERLLKAGKEFDSILAADIRPAFDLVATGGPSRLLKLWDSRTGELVKSVKKHSDWITALDLSPDGVLLASGDRNGGVWVWESDTANEFHTLRAHQAAITSVTFRADSNILATTSEDGTLRFWEMNGGSEVKKIDAHPGGVTAHAFARDGSSLSTGRDRSAKLWKSDFNPARVLAKKLPNLPTAAAMDSDAKRAFIGDSRGIVHVFDSADGKPVGKIHSNPPSIETRLNQIRAARKAPSLSPKALAALEKSRKHWQAAAINSRHLLARQQATEATLHNHDLQLDFTAAAQQVTRLATNLNRKRSKRSQLKHFAANPQNSPNTLAEIMATLTAIDLVIKRELEFFQSAEADLVLIKQSINPASQLAHDKARQSTTLHQSYHQALK